MRMANGGPRLPINHSLLPAPPHLPRSASQARDSRAIQFQASAIDLNSPISSSVPSSHSASTYQWLASAALISRGLKIGRGNLGMLVDTSAAARASTVVVTLAEVVCGPATRHAANMGWVADTRHPKADSSTNGRARTAGGGRTTHLDTSGRARRTRGGSTIAVSRLSAATVVLRRCRSLRSPCGQRSEPDVGNVRPGPPASLVQQVQSPEVCRRCLHWGNPASARLTAGPFSFPLTGDP